MDLENQAQRVLRETFGHEEFRPGQEEVIDALTAGQHVLAVMPTGSGKSLCYQIPALLRDGLTLVVSPLIALMEDQVAALRLSGVPADAINSSRSREENLEIWHRARRRVSNGDPHILYLAPERLMESRMLEIVRQLQQTRASFRRPSASGWRIPRHRLQKPRQPAADRKKRSPG